MNRLANVLSRLNAFAAVSPDGRLTKPMNVDAELAGLDRRLLAMRDRPMAGSAVEVPRIDLDALFARWANSAGDVTRFTKRELRALCWDSRTVADERFIRAIDSIPQLASNARVLRGLWYAHERQWRLNVAPKIEQLILAKQLGGRVAPVWMRELWTSKDVLSSGAPQALALRAKTNWRDALSSLSQVAVTPDGALGTAAVAEMMKLWIADVLSQRSAESAVATFDAGLEGLLSEQRLPMGLVRMAVEALVGSVRGQKESYRQRIAQWIVEDPRLGHPARRRTRGNWAGISERTRQLAVQLFANRDLGAFFQILIGAGDDEQQRRAFWERYTDSEQLLNFAIASDPYDRQKLLSVLGRNNFDVAHLDYSPAAHSAFLMHFRGSSDIVVAEMSKPNNAMYLYVADAFEKHVGDLQESRFTFRELKNQLVNKERHSHVPGWHRRFAYVLARYGVYPAPGARR